MFVGGRKMNILIILSLFLIIGLLSTRVMKVFNLPNVTGYLLGGLLIGPAMIGIFNNILNIVPEQFIKDYKEIVTSFSVITNIALGFIALSIGVEFKLENIKKMGKDVFIITFFQCFLTVFAVDIALAIYAKATNMNLSVALTLGAISSATAPAATLLVIKQYGAHGKLVDTLLPVVALDDATGLMAFSISFAISKIIALGEEITVFAVLINPLLEIILSLLIGLLCGFLMTFISNIFKSRNNNSILMIAFTLLCVGLSQIEFKFGMIEFSLSSLLVCIMLGATYTNLKKDSERFLHRIDEITPFLFLLFFVISGADIDLSIIPQVGIIGIIYLSIRSLGKYFGAYCGCKVTKSDSNITKYLGLTLLPQAGVAIGMANIARNQLGEYGLRIYTVVLFSTFVYEIVGPLISKWALKKAGEIE